MDSEHRRRLEQCCGAPRWACAVKSTTGEDAMLANNFSQTRTPQINAQGFFILRGNTVLLFLPLFHFTEPKAKSRS